MVNVKSLNTENVEKLEIKDIKKKCCFKRPKIINKPEIKDVKKKSCLKQLVIIDIKKILF